MSTRLVITVGVAATAIVACGVMQSSRSPRSLPAAMGGGLGALVAQLHAQESPASAGARVYKERCAVCHDAPEAMRAPARDALRARSVPQIIASLSPGGVMAEVGQDLSAAEKQAVAAFLSAAPSANAAGTDPGVGVCPPSNTPLPDIASMPMWNGWGNDVANTRFQSAKAAGITAADVPKLTVKWAFGFPGATSAAGQPTVAAGRVFVGNVNSMVYALDARTGCTHWSFKADGGVRTAISVARIAIGGTPRTIAMFGDVRANAYAVDAETGAQIWKTKVDAHAVARITGAPAYANGRLYVPVSSTEEVPGARPTYPCCTFRGSVVALDAATGTQVWKSYMITEEPKMVGKNSTGTPIWKPAGAAVWTSPTVDVAKNLIYVATGNAYTSPAAETSDAVVALDMATGAIRWVQQATPNDTFVIGCKPGVENCPDDVGPDYDFGNSAILRTLPGGRRVLTLGQKSGVVYGLAPDDGGKILWQFRAGKGGALGGIEWGSAADEQNIYVPVSDVLEPPAEAGGLFAIRLATGERAWHTPAPPLTCKSGPGCTGAQSAAVSVMPGVVFSGSVDGHLRAYSTLDGKIIWAFNTMQPFETVNGVKAQGGSIDAAGPVIAGGLVLTNSGYGQWRGKAGNVLLAFGLP
ncbi:MAG: outer membrane protein assembly factor BamB family protein [Acidobacteriota bacterium]